MTTKTLTPAVDAVLFGDAARDIQLVIAGHADVVITGIAFETVVAGVAGWYRDATDVAKCCEAQRAENNIRNGGVIGTPTERGRLGRQWRRCSGGIGWG